MTRALVTGASGFIGGHLVRRLLDRKDSVRVLCRPSNSFAIAQLSALGAEVVLGDLRDEDSLTRAMRDVDVVFHCAGLASDCAPKEEVHLINVKGTQLCLEAARQQGVKRFVHLSSFVVLGKYQDPYTATKREGEKLVRSFSGKYSLPTTILRPPIVYGPDAPWVVGPIHAMLHGRLPLIDGGRGNCHLLHVDDLISAMVLASERSEAVGKTFFVGGAEPPITFKNYFDRLSEMIGVGPISRSFPTWLVKFGFSSLRFLCRVSGFQTRAIPYPAIVDFLVNRDQIEDGAIERDFGFKPAILFQEGMERLRDWYWNEFHSELFLESLFNDVTKYANLKKVGFSVRHVLFAMNNNTPLREAFRRLYQSYQCSRSIEGALRENPGDARLMFDFSEYLHLISKPFLAPHFRELGTPQKRRFLPVSYYAWKGRSIAFLCRRLTRNS